MKNKELKKIHLQPIGLIIVISIKIMLIHVHRFLHLPLQKNEKEELNKMKQCDTH